MATYKNPISISCDTWPLPTPPRDPITAARDPETIATVTLIMERHLDTSVFATMEVHPLALNKVITFFPAST